MTGVDASRSQAAESVIRTYKDQEREQGLDPKSRNRGNIGLSASGCTAAIPAE
jgi:hypothetical protein